MLRPIKSAKHVLLKQKIICDFIREVWWRARFTPSAIRDDMRYKRKVYMFAPSLYTREITNVLRYAKIEQEAQRAQKRPENAQMMNYPFRVPPASYASFQRTMKGPPKTAKARKAKLSTFVRLRRHEVARMNSPFIAKHQAVWRCCMRRHMRRKGLLLTR